MNEAVKTCSKCKNELPVGSFYKDKSVKNQLMSKCKSCKERQHTSWKKANPEKVAAQKTRYRKKHPEMISAAQARYRKKYKSRFNKNSLCKIKAWEKANPEKVRKSKRINEKKKCENLSDSYIKKTIAKGTTLKYSDIPPELIKLKRVQLLITRQLREAR